MSADCPQPAEFAEVADQQGPSAQDDALLALSVFAVNPFGCAGLHLCGLPGPGRDAVLRAVRRALPAPAPAVRVPCHVSDDRLLGGLDLAATLDAREPVVARGLLAAADVGAVTLAMAERLPERIVASLLQVMDSGCVQLERDGFSDRQPCRFAVVALDESLADDERLHAGLADRLALRIYTDHLDATEIDELLLAPDDLDEARATLATATAPDAVLTAICHTALALGIGSLRGSALCLQVARTVAALDGSATVDDEHAAAAVRLVLSPRATQLPPAPEEPDAEHDEPSPPKNADEPDSSRDPPAGELDDVLIEAATAALPPGLLDALSSAARQRSKTLAGRAGAGSRAPTRGRPIGDRPLRPGDAVRLNVLATLKTAAPWQRLRGGGPERLAIRREDFRVTRYKSKTRTTAIFVVDASGSSAAQRLGEVKGAVELLLADCYVRRDQVALIAFRGTGAEVLLAPTRSLVRAKRELANLPGGGPTPLACAIDAARELGVSLRRQGQQPLVILLTDGRGNVGRDGTRGHPEAAAHTQAAAAEFAGTGMQAMVVDVSRRPRETGRELARAMGGLYLPLPFADAASISQAVQSTVASAA
ncbi:MAG: magnesium chelatase subunit D [Pseudomonadota bacterium]